MVEVDICGRDFFEDELVQTVPHCGTHTKISGREIQRTATAKTKIVPRQPISDIKWCAVGKDKVPANPPTKVMACLF